MTCSLEQDRAPHECGLETIHKRQGGGRGQECGHGPGKFLNQRPRSWYHALPLALWGLNDLPGLVAPYSPHREVFGRDTVGSGDCPSIVPGEGAQEAQDFFDRLASERKQVHDHLVKLHHDTSAILTAKFREVCFREGDRVWVRDLLRRDQPNFNKLKRIWQGPYEILR